MCLKILFDSVNRFRVPKTFRQTVPEFWGVINKGCLSVPFNSDEVNQEV